MLEIAMAKCRVWWDESIQAYRSQWPYNAQVVQFLKSNIPSSDRSMDENKVWTFTESYLDGCIAFFKLIWGTSEVAVVTREQYEKAKAPPRTGVAVSNSDSNAQMLADFMRMIPYEAAREAYRKAAIMLHPDRGGDMEKMSKVNALWTRIQKEIYGQ